MIWVFPLYWALITTFKPEHEVVRPYIELWPDTFTLDAYVYIIANTEIGIWYLNSIITRSAITVARRRSWPRPAATPSPSCASPAGRCSGG